MPQVIRIQDQNDLVPTASYPYGHWHFENFNPVQSRLIEHYEGDSNVAVAAATSAGKTVSAELYMAYEVRKRKGKALYVGPLKALAKQNEQDWKRDEHHFSNLKTAICTGDYRITANRIHELDESDLLVMTPEMLASRCRNHKSEKSSFLKEIGTIVFDESHLLTVPSRGDHIEVALMKITEINPNVRIVLLSATMPNVDQICGWITSLTKRDTYYLESTYRPCPLSIHYETYYDGDRKYEDKEIQKVGTALGIVKYYPDDKFLIFVHSKTTGKMMIESLRRHKIDSEFHNADLSLDKRLALEDKFKNDPNFKVIVATSTLAWGLNLPARRVIVLGVHRGIKRVENYDIQQMIGRAGRPCYDPRGDAYILVPESAKSETVHELQKKTPIRSQLLEDFGGHHKTLAFHAVSEIHHGNIRNKEEFHEWFRKSLAHYQNHDFDDQVVDKLIELLARCKAIVIEDGTYKATSVGTIASMFYYSPFDVADLKNNFFKMFNEHKENDDYQLAVCLGNIDTHRFGIANKAEKNEMSRFQKKVESVFGKGNVTDSSIKVAYAYFNMLNGLENSTFSNLQSNLRFDSDRLLEVLNAVDTMSGKWGQKDYFNKLKLRLTYGVSSDLVYLCMIPNVGKARAEKLWKAGIQSVDAFANTDAKTLSTVMKLKEDKIAESLNGARLLRIKNAL